MEIKKVTQTEWIGEATKYIHNALHKIAYVVVERPVAIVHRKTQVDEPLCDNLGYDVIESYNNGGTIISNKGDVLIGHFYSPENGWCKRFAEYFINWLKSKGLNACYEANDILVDAYKVADGWSLYADKIVEAS